MRTVFELAAGHQAQAAALGEQRKLKVFTEDFCRDVDGELQPIERLHQRGAASASRWIQKPVLVGQIAQAPRASAGLGRHSGCGNDNDLFSAKGNAGQAGWNGVGLRQQANGAIERAAANVLNEICTPVRADLEADAGKGAPQRIERRRHDDFAEAMRDACFQIAGRIGCFRGGGFQLRHG